MISGAAHNDLCRVIEENGVEMLRFDGPQQAVEHAPPGRGVLILADGYPEETTEVGAGLFEQAAAKHLRLYVEYPSMLPGLQLGPPRGHKTGAYGSKIDREVITSDAFGTSLKELRLLLIHACRYLPVEGVPHSHIVTAQVAGFDYAVFGLPEQDVWPILFEHPEAEILVATTKLSHFVTARYAPTDAWPWVWRMILGWLQSSELTGHKGQTDEDTANPSGPLLKWTPTVRPTYGRADALPSDAERKASRACCCMVRELPASP